MASFDVKVQQNERAAESRILKFTPIDVTMELFFGCYTMVWLAAGNKWHGRTDFGPKKMYLPGRINGFATR